MNVADRTPSVPVAIVGMGCLFPKAEDLGRYWVNICSGVDAIREVPPTHWDPADYHDDDPKAPDRTYAHRGGFLDPVDFPALDFGIAPANLDATDTTQLLGLLVARAALEDAGYGPGRAFDRDRVSVVLGVTGTLELVIPLGARLGHPIWRRALKEAGVAEPVASEVVRRIADSYVGWQENSFPGLLGNVAAGRIANRLDLGGTNCVVDAACASTMGAVHLAILELAAGRCDVALTGGLDTFNDIFMYMCFSKTPALSPTGDARPFSAASDGTILGEGLGVLTLKRLDDARRDGDRIYAVIKGVGSSSDGKGNAVYAPSAAGQAKCLRRAYESAGVTPETIELVEAHGTGTRVGDAVELSALAEVYRSAKADGTWCALGSVKSQIGHTKAAAGAAGLIKAALALYHKVLPPTIKVDQPAELARPGASPFYVNTEARPWLPSAGHPRRAGVSAFGFGGSNFHAVLEEADPEPAGVAWDGDVQIVAHSGATPDALRAALDAWPAGLPWEAFRGAAARSRASFRADHPCRLAIVAERDGIAWPKLVDRARSLIGGPTANGPEGVYYATGPVAGGLAALFPGQGSQYVGMFRDLACRFPALRATLAQANAGAPGLGDRIYPHPSFDDEGRQRAERALRSTDVAQPAIGAASLGAYRILEGFGVRPDAVAGHSFGELTALHAAGRIDAPSFFELARLRGRLMAGDGGDRGGMIAVLAPVDAIEGVVRDEGLDLVIANRNAPRQSVLSGPSAEVARASEAFGRRGVQARTLEVSAAFHSRLVADASGPLAAALAKVAVEPSPIPVYANATAEPYPADAGSARAILADQLARPVRFVDQVEAMARSGIRTFVEVGPDAKLAGLVGSILGDRPHAVLSIDASRGKRGNVADLARALAHLAALGHPIRLAAWDEGAEARASAARKPGLTVKVSGANFAPQPPAPASPSQPSPPSFPIAAPIPEPRPKMMTPPPADLPPAPTAPEPRPGRNGSAAPTANGHALAPMAPTRPAAPATRSTPDAPPAPAAFLVEAIRASQENLVALRRVAEQTAGLHRQYLEGQDRATQAFHSLLDHHQRLTLAALGMPVAAPAPLPALAVEGPTRAPVPEPRPLAPAPVLAPASPPLPTAPAPRSASPTPRPEVPKAAPAPRLPEPSKPAPAVASMASAAQSALLEVVSEKTGYPAEVLEPGMELDADLGIDSIKRVEILAALQERLPGSPVIGPEHLGTIRTLGQIAEFLGGPAAAAPVAAPAPAVPPVVPPAEKPGPSEPVRRLVPTAVPLKGAEARGSVTLRDGGEVWVLDDGTGLAESIVERLDSLGYRGRLVDRGSIGSLAAPGSLSGLILLGPEPGDAFRLLRLAAPGLRRAGGEGGASLLTVSRLGGTFGLTGLAGGADVASGALAGLAKTAGHEWPEVDCKAVDLDPAWTGAEAAPAIVEELLTRGPAEVGLAPGGRTTIALRSEPVGPASGAGPFSAGDLVVITGGARGVTAEVAVGLASGFRPTVAILGRSPAPGPEAAWLAPLVGEAEIKRALHARAGGRATPRELDDQFRQVAANREVLANLGRIEAAGAKVAYRSVDVRDRDAVEAAVGSLRAEFGPVRGLVHGAGVLADRRIEDQADDQFARVFETKVAGLDALLGAIGGDDLRALVLFSSSTARFGRSGQVAYAAANEALNKRARREAQARPGCRVVAVNWGPWAGGMVTPALRPLFEAEGIALIPVEQGAKYLVEELRAGGDRPVEVVILGGGGPEPDFLRESEPGEDEAPASSMTRVFERTLDVASTPILRSHVMDGRPVLPMALILEWLAQGATTRHPGLVCVGVDDLRLLKGVVLRDARAEVIRVLAGKSTRRDGLSVVPVELRGVRADGREVLHARAEVVLGDRHPDPVAPLDEPALPPYPATRREIYRDALFHGHDLQGIGRVDGCGESGIVAGVHTAPPPSTWIEKPLRQQWLTDPLAIDCAFQLMILWSLDRSGSGSLPTFVGRYRQFRRAFPVGGVRVVARVTESGPRKARADVDFLDAEGGLVARIEDYECVIDASLTTAFRRNRAAQVESK